MTVRNHLITDKCDVQPMIYLDGSSEFHAIMKTDSEIVANNENLIM